MYKARLSTGQKSQSPCGVQGYLPLRAGSTGGTHYCVGCCSPVNRRAATGTRGHGSSACEEGCGEPVGAVPAVIVPLLLVLASEMSPPPVRDAPAAIGLELLEFVGEWSVAEGDLIDLVLPAAESIAEGIGEFGVVEAELPAEERERRVAAGAARWQEMKREERELARQRLERWKRLSPAQRAVLLDRRIQYRHLPPEDRERLRVRSLEFRRAPAPEPARSPLLTPDQSRALRDCLQRQAESIEADCRELLPDSMRPVREPAEATPVASPAPP